MTGEIRAQRAIVQLGEIQVEGFMLPDSSYRMSQTQTAEIVGKSRQSVSDFLRTKSFKRLLDKVGGVSGFSGDSPFETFTVEIGEGGSQGQTRIIGLPLIIVFIYWAWESFRGNREALHLIIALGVETLERRFDRAFGVSRSEDDWNQRLSDRIIAQLENDVAAVLTEVDAALNRERLLEQQLRDNGIEPWALPGDDSNLPS